MDKKKLIVFVKNEEAGKTKTRLAADVGDEKALEVYQKLLDYTRQVVVDVAAEKEIWYSRFIPEKDRWSKRPFGRKVQKGKDLGERMSAAFEVSFEEGYSKVVIIGSDCAELTSDIIEQAFAALDESEFVVGPAEDGGYYLLGMREFHPEVFEDIAWSTGSVLEKTVVKMKDLGGSVKKLPQLNDVDTVDDWKRVKEHL